MFVENNVEYAILREVWGILPFYPFCSQLLDNGMSQSDVSDIRFLIRIRPRMANGEIRPNGSKRLFTEKAHLSGYMVCHHQWFWTYMYPILGSTVDLNCDERACPPNQDLMISPECPVENWPSQTYCWMQSYGVSDFLLLPKSVWSFSTILLLSST